MGKLAVLHFVLPVAMSLRFPEAFIVESTSGTTPTAEFVWQVEQTPGRFEVIDAQTRDARLLEAPAAPPHSH